MDSPWSRVLPLTTRALVALVLSVASPLLTAPLSAQGAFATLRGVVTDATSQQPITGVRVVIAATGRYATTDSLGVFELREIPSGVIRFFFTASGYPRTSVVLALAKGERMVQRFELESIAAEAAAARIRRRAASSASQPPR